MRQEFHELQLLDDIIKPRYEGKLLEHIQGKFRNPLIRTYQKWKGTDYGPSLTHPALTCSVKDPMPLLSVVTDVLWQIIDKKKKREGKIETTSIWPGFVAGKGRVPVKSKKCKHLMNKRIKVRVLKKQRQPQWQWPLTIPPHLMDLYGMVIIIVVHMLCSLQSYMTSGVPTQWLGQEGSRKSTSAILNQCLLVSQNI